MQDPKYDYQPPNIQVELAKKRNQAAAERTLMAWIRTSLSLISFGFGIDQIVAAISRSVGNGKIDEVSLTYFLGLSFIGLGIFAMLMAALQHRQELRHIQRDPYLYIPQRSLGLTVAGALVVIGSIAFIGTLLRIKF